MSTSKKQREEPWRSSSKRSNLQNKRLRNRILRRKKKIASPKKEEVTESKKEEVPNEEKKDDKPEQQEEFKINEEELVPNFALNPNVFCDLKLGGTPEEIEQDEELVKKASTFLKDHVLPVMVDEFSWFVSLPVDGQTLTATMHSKGINIRYLGAVATLAENAKLRIVKDIAVREMICRAVKYILREVIVDVEDMVLAPVVSHFLNCMFGEVAEPPQKAVVNKTSGAQKKNKKKNKNAKKPITESLYTNKLWTKITNEVKERFQYDLPDRKSLKEITHNIATLRAVSQKLGLQLEARDYVFTSESPFKPEDLLNIYPLVKHCNPETSDAKNLLEAGKSFIQQGRIDIAYELLSEALAIFHQVYGPMHKDTANCYSNLAMVLYHAKDVPQAVDHQQKAAVINERVQGLDHYDTAQSYGNLALFIHTLGKFTTGLSFIRRCLFLSRLTSGANHPETASTFTNIAMMLQDMQQPKQSIEYLLQALKSYETFLGPNNIQTAAIYHAIAIAFSQMEQFKEALIYEKKNYNILVQRMGENDFRVLESNIYLKQFTQKAVAMQIENKKAQQQLKQDNSLSGLQKTIISSTPGKGGIVQTVGASIGSLGTRPLSELLAYINDKPTGHNRSFKQRNQKKFTAQNGEQQPTPSPQQQPHQNGGSHPVENGVKKASKKKKKKTASPSLPVTVEK